MALATLTSVAAVLVLVTLVWGDPLLFLQAVDRPKPPLFADFVRHYFPTVTKLLDSGEPAYGYFYPPSFACWLLPLASLSPQGAWLAWGGVQVAASLALMLLTGLALGRFGRGFGVGAVVLTAFSFPFWHSFRWGQVSVLMMALMVAAMVTFRRAPRASPLLLALATSIKGLPVILALPWLVRREFRPLLRFAAAALLLAGLVPLLVLGPTKTWGFVSKVRQASAGALATWVPQDPNSQFLPHVVARWSRAEGETAPLRPSTGLKVGVWLLFLAALGTALRRARHDSSDPLLVVGLLLAGLPLILPTAWPHYFVYLPLVQTAALAWAASLAPGPRRLGTLVLVGVSILFASLPMFALAGGQPRYTALGLVGVGNALLVVALLLLAWTDQGDPSGSPSGPFNHHGEADATGGTHRRQAQVAAPPLELGQQLKGHPRPGGPERVAD